MILSILLAFFLQASPTPQTLPFEPSVLGLLNDAEKNALIRSSNLQARTQALLAAAKRLLKEAEQMLKTDKPRAMLDSLESYTRILESCEKLMHAQPPENKRPNYKKQEIELRRQLKTLDDLLAGSDLEEKPAIQEVIRTAAGLRTHFLTTFFGKDSLKRP